MTSLMTRRKPTSTSLFDLDGTTIFWGGRVVLFHIPVPMLSSLCTSFMKLSGFYSLLKVHLLQPPLSVKTCFSGSVYSGCSHLVEHVGNGEDYGVQSTEVGLGAA